MNLGLGWQCRSILCLQSWPQGTPFPVSNAETLTFRAVDDLAFYNSFSKFLERSLIRFEKVIVIIVVHFVNVGNVLDLA